MNWDNEENKGVKKGPWGAKKPDTGNKTSQDQGEGGSDVEEILRQAHNSFSGVFIKDAKFGKNKKPSNLGAAGMVFAFVAVLWLGTGFYRVLPEENAVILTFGKWTSTRTDPGLGYRIPWPVQDIKKVNVAFDRRIEIGFRDNGSSYRDKVFSRKDSSVENIKSESQMLTGDENIVDIDFVVMWNIADAKEYLFEIRDPDATIKKVAESAMREVIGRGKIQSALTEGRADIESQAKNLMQTMLDEYKSGVIVNNVQMLRVDPPEPVVDAFDDVQRARADKERASNEAESYQNDVVPRARGEAQKILQDAEAYKESAVNKANGDAARFNSVYEAYKQSEDVTKKRLYIETMQEIMHNSRKFIIDGNKGASVLPYLPLEGLKK